MRQPVTDTDGFASFRTDEMKKKITKNCMRRVTRWCCCHQRRCDGIATMQYYSIAHAN